MAKLPPIDLRVYKAIINWQIDSKPSKEDIAAQMAQQEAVIKVHLATIQDLKAKLYKEECRYPSKH